MRKLKLHIAQPCHEQWQNMTPSEKGRFCDACRKQVVDFTMMSDREIVQFFKKRSTGSVCGRFLNEQLDTPITIPKKRIPWIKYFFQIALPAFLLSLKAGAQKPKLINKPAVVSTPPTTVGDTIFFPIPETIKGTVCDENGVPIPLAKVCIKDTSLVTVTDTDGHFTMETDSRLPVIERLPADSVQLEVTAHGYADSLVPVSFVLQDYKIELIRPDTFILEGVTWGFTIPEIVYRDFYPIDVRIYPNPLDPGKTVTIEWESDSKGKMIIKIDDMQGRAVLKQVIHISKGQNKVPIDTDPNWVRGFYIIQLYDPKGKRVFGEKILIQ
jgi:hypothetical protein